MCNAIFTRLRLGRLTHTLIVVILISIIIMAIFDWCKIVFYSSLGNSIQSDRIFFSFTSPQLHRATWNRHLPSDQMNEIKTRIYIKWIPSLNTRINFTGRARARPNSQQRWTCSATDDEIRKGVLLRYFPFKFEQNRKINKNAAESMASLTL